MTDFVVGPEVAGARLDRAASELSGRSRTDVSAAIDAGAVTVDGAVTKKKSLRVSEGQVLRIGAASTSEAAEPQPTGPPARIVFEDSEVIVVSKPPGMVVHPAPSLKGWTLVHQLAQIETPPVGGDPKRPGIVHRLDRDTSGLLVVARTQDSYENLVAQLANRTVGRRYLALLVGKLDQPRVTVDAPIGRDPRRRTRMAVVPEGKEAITEFEEIEDLGDLTLVAANLRTGRTHQIRVHSRVIDAPVCGDELYESSGAVAARLGLRRPFLHAQQLRFIHPSKGEAVSFEESLPEDLKDALDVARSEVVEDDARPPHRRGIEDLT